jgi:hypothetical protein
MFKDRSRATALNTVLLIRQFERRDFVEEIVLGRALDYLNYLKLILLQEQDD